MGAGAEPSTAVVSSRLYCVLPLHTKAYLKYAPYPGISRDRANYSTPNFSLFFGGRT